MSEVWKPVPGYEGLYEVSNMGRVYSLPKSHNGGAVKYVTKKRLLKLSVGSTGYQMVCLYKDGKKKIMSVHRLVALAFISNIDNLPEVNHIDGDRVNNIVCNLEWVTSLENNRHHIHRERMRRSLTELLGKKVVQLSLDGLILNVFSSVQLAADYIKKSGSSISGCCRGVRKTAYGYRWCYYGDENGDDNENDNKKSWLTNSEEKVNQVGEEG